MDITNPPWIVAGRPAPGLFLLLEPGRWHDHFHRQWTHLLSEQGAKHAPWPFYRHTLQAHTRHRRTSTPIPGCHSSWQVRKEILFSGLTIPHYCGPSPGSRNKAKHSDQTCVLLRLIFISAFHTSRCSSPFPSPRCSFPGQRHSFISTRAIDTKGER